jgi:hypothetical protein
MAPDCSLFSDAWRETANGSIKVLILDEAQISKSPHSLSHRAIKQLFYKRITMLTGKLQDQVSTH